MVVKEGYRQTDAGPIPQDWVDMPFAGVVASYMDYRGRTPRKLGMEWGGGSILALSASNVQMGRIDPAKEANLGSEELYRRWMVQGDCECGDVLLTMEAPLGNVAQIPDSRKYILSQRVLLIRPRKWLLGDFLAHYMRGSAFQRQLVANSTGTTAKGIQRARLDTVPVGLPSGKAEQGAIAEALSDADALIEALEKLIAKKRQIKQGAMQRLLTGRGRLPGFKSDWREKRLGDLAETDPDNLGADTSPDFAFNYIALEDVAEGTLTDYSERMFGTAPSRARRRLAKDDVLVSTVRPNLKSHLLFSADDGNWVCSTGFCVVRCRRGVSHPGYVYFHMFGDRVTRQIGTLLTGSNYPAINSNDVRALLLPAPEYEEQAAIAAVLSDMDTEVSALESKLAKARQIKQGMMQELLTGRIRLV